MNLLVALVVGTIFAAGAHLMVQRDAVKLAAGTLLVSNAAILLLVSASFGVDRAPFAPVADPRDVADPLVQALALTGVVIGFGTTILLLRVALAVARSHDSIDVEDLVSAEVSEDERREAPSSEDGREPGD